MIRKIQTLSVTLLKALILLTVLLLIGWVTLPIAHAESTVIKFVDEEHGQEPWITNLTSKGTHLLKDIDKGKMSSFAFFGGDDQSVSLNGYQYFIASNSIYRSDGTAKRTKVEGNIDEMQINNLVKYNNKLYFTINDQPSLYRVFPRGQAISASSILTFDQSKVSREILSIESGAFDNKMLLLIHSQMHKGNGKSYDLRLSNGQRGWSKILNYQPKPSHGSPKRLARIFITGRNIYLLDDYESEIWKIRNTTQAPKIAQLTKFTLPKDVALNPTAILADKNHLYFASLQGDIYKTDGSQKRTKKINKTKLKNEDYFKFVKLFKNHIIVHAITGQQSEEINTLYKLNLSTGKWSKLKTNHTSRRVPHG